MCHTPVIELQQQPASIWLWTHCLSTFLFVIDTLLVSCEWFAFENTLHPHFFKLSYTSSVKFPFPIYTTYKHFKSSFKIRKIYAPHYLLVMQATSFIPWSSLDKNPNIGVFKFQHGNKTSNLKLLFISLPTQVMSSLAYCLLKQHALLQFSITTVTKWGNKKEDFNSWVNAENSKLLNTWYKHAAKHMHTLKKTYNKIIFGFNHNK